MQNTRQLIAHRPWIAIWRSAPNTLDVKITPDNTNDFAIAMCWTEELLFHHAGRSKFVDITLQHCTNDITIAVRRTGANTTGTDVTSICTVDITLQYAGQLTTHVMPFVQLTFLTLQLQYAGQLTFLTLQWPDGHRGSDAVQLTVQWPDGH